MPDSKKTARDQLNTGKSSFENSAFASVGFSLSRTTSLYRRFLSVFLLYLCLYFSGSSS